MKLSNENINKIVWGGIYSAKGTDIEKYNRNYTAQLNNQKYGWWIPAHARRNNEEYYVMIDTYQISRGLFNNQYSYDKEIVINSLIEGLEKLKDPDDNGNWASEMPFKYYYSAIVELTDKNFNIFKLEADLHDYKITNQDECRYYNEEDIIKGLKLYNEHNYPIGIIIVKKDAKINYKNKIDAKLYDIRQDINQPRFCSDYIIEELLNIEKEAIEKEANYDKRQLDATIKYNNFMKNLNRLANDYFNEIKDDIYNS